MYQYDIAKTDINIIKMILYKHIFFYKKLMIKMFNINVYNPFIIYNIFYIT